MDEAIEEDTCRICAGPADDNAPLFHPCKCSGTIRYIHQDCLRTWLDHSNKTTCDVCKHKYAFTKVYAPNMPTRLPVALFLRRLYKQLTGFALLALRGALVGVVWLAFLPYTTVWMWRFYFWTGEVIAWFTAGRTRPPTNITRPMNITLPFPSSTLNIRASSINPNITIKIGFTLPILRTLSSDIFTGQIITSLIVLLFLSLFLLREWIFQNARGDDALEEEAPADAAAADPVAQEAPQGEQNAAEDANEQADDQPPPLMNASDDSDAEAEAPAPAPAPAAPPPSLDSDRIAPLPQLFDDEYHGVKGVFGSGGDAEMEAGWETLRKTQLDLKEKAKAMRTRATVPSKGATMEEHGDNMWPEETWSNGAETGSVDDLLEASGSQSVLPTSQEPAINPELNSLSETGVVSIGPLSSSNLHLPEGLTQDMLPEDLTSEDLKLIPSRLSAEEYKSIADRLSRSKAIDREKEELEGFPTTKTAGTLITARTYNPTPRGVKRKVYSPQLSSSSLPNLASGSEYGPIGTQAKRRKGANAGSSTLRSIADSLRPGLPEAPVAESGGDIPSGPPVDANSKGKERAAAPPQIVLDRLPPGRSAAPISPTEVSPRRPLLSPAVAAPRRRTPFQYDGGEPAGNDEEEPRGRMTTERSPGRALYRAPEDMDYFGDVEDAQEDADVVEEPGAAHLPAVQDSPLDPAHLQPPARDLTANVPNPVAVEDEPGAVGWGNGYGFGIAGLAPPPPEEEGHEPRQDRMAVMEEVRVPVELQRGNAAPNAPPPPAAAQAAAAAAAAAPARDDEEREREAAGGAEDDMDGALEAVGMKGPIFQLFQNAALMICILDVTIAVAVWFPFILGKSACLLSLNPSRVLRWINLPIKVVRLITDPVVDGVLVILRYVLTLPFHLLPGAALSVLRDCAKHLPILGNQSTQEQSVTSATLVQTLRQRMDTLTRPYQLIVLKSLYSALGANPLTEDSLADLTAVLELLKPRFHALLTTLKSQYETLVEIDTAWSRALAIAVGYFLIGVALAAWMSSTKQQRMKGFMDGIRNAVRQQLLVVKVAVFIVIELVLFPLGCGIVLDLCALPLFEDATVLSRVAFSLHAPITSAFLHWMMGTMFMFQFAIILDGCRKVMRPGAMWFVKDPQDPQFSPIQDIMSRPAGSQLRKLFTSALMYCMVVFGGLGTVILFLRYLPPFRGFLPLYWNMREPLSEVPVDLLYLHIVLPQIIRQLRFRRFFKERATQTWKFLSRRLRLTSYMFGGRHTEEESSLAHGGLFRWKRVVDDGGVALEMDGGLYRAPANDHIVLVPRTRMLVPVDETGEPVDDAARERRDIQDAEALRHGRNPQDDYTIVYLPPNFRRRVALFMWLMWLIGVTSAVVFIAGPMLTGRAIMELLSHRRVHDGYCFGIGFQVLALAYYVGRVMTFDFQHGRGFSPFKTLFKRIRRTIIWLSKMLWLTIGFEVIIPTLLGIAFDLHFVIPMRHWLIPHATPTLHVIEDWALGSVLSKIIARLLRLRLPLPGIVRALDAVRLNGWEDPKIGIATREVIVPVSATLSAVIVLPGLFAWVLLQTGAIVQFETLVYRFIYPFWVLVAMEGLLFSRLYKLVGMWVQAVRDREFLVEMRLRNLET